MSDYSDVDTVSAYEVGSVQFLADLQHLEAWAEAGVPVSGDATTCARHRLLDRATTPTTQKVER